MQVEGEAHESWPLRNYVLNMGFLRSRRRISGMALGWLHGPRVACKPVVHHCVGAPAL